MYLILILVLTTQPRACDWRLDDVGRSRGTTGAGGGVTGWVRMSILSGAKTMPISGVIREKKQRLGAVSGGVQH